MILPLMVVTRYARQLVVIAAFSSLIAALAPSLLLHIALQYKRDRILGIPPHGCCIQLHWHDAEAIAPLPAPQRRLGAATLLL